jgi:hypothetical protein
LKEILLKIMSAEYRERSACVVAWWDNTALEMHNKGVRPKNAEHSLTH